MKEKMSIYTKMMLTVTKNSRWIYENGYWKLGEYGEIKNLVEAYNIEKENIIPSDK